MKLMAGTRRFSKQRQLIFDTACSLHCHPTADDIYSIVKGRIPAISLGTVYRNLNILAEQKEIGKIEPGEGATKFDFRTDPHYHLRCRECGRLFDADLPLLEGLDSRVQNTHGFTIEKHNIEFVGICSDCKNKIK